MRSARLRLDPVVVFSILDHYVRRNENQDSVIGALLGSKAPDGCLEVRSTIPVPHTAGEDHLSIDVEFQRIMKELCAKVDPKNFIVGWYSTAYTENSQFLHDFYAKNIPNPIHLLVDPTLKGNSLNVRALISQQLQLGGRTLGPFFREISFEWKTSDAEKIAIATMLQQQPVDEPQADDTEDEDVSALRTWDTLQVTMGRLHANIEKAHNYVTQVLNGSVREDKSIGRTLAAVAAQLPLITPSTFDKVFSDSLQDMLMVVYLSKLTKYQLALTEKLHNTYSPAFFS